MGRGGRSRDRRMAKPCRALQELASISGFILRTVGALRKFQAGESYLKTDSEMEIHMQETYLWPPQARERSRTGVGEGGNVTSPEPARGYGAGVTLQSSPAVEKGWTL